MLINSFDSVAKALQSISNPFAKLSFSSFGEDLVCEALFRPLIKNRVGFYIDVGCHHPFRASNTALFYLQGWQGINIDANSDAINMFNQHRPNDVNILSAIGEKTGEGFFYKFENLPAINTLSKSMAIKQAKKFNKNFSIEAMKVSTLDEILEKNLNPEKGIDLLSIDIEGLDFEVISSMNLDKYKPLCIVIEDFVFNPSTPMTSPIYSHLAGNSYKLVARCYVSSIFMRKDI